MSLYSTLFLSYTFLKAKYLQYSLAFFGIFLGTLLFFVFFSITQEIKENINTTFASQEQYITIRPKPNSAEVLTDAVLESLEDLPSIKKVYKEKALVLPFTFNIPIPFSQDISLDLYFIHGIEDELFALQSQESTTSKATPVLLNPLSIELINSFVQSMAGNITLSNNLFLHQEVTVTLGKSSFLPAMNRESQINKTFVVDGFSSLAPIVGVALPLSTVEAISQTFGEQSSHYSKFHIIPQNGASIVSIKEHIQAKDLVIQSGNGITDRMLEMVSFLQIILLISSLSVLILSFVFLFTIIQVLIKERIQSIGILQAMGMNNANIASIFVIQSGGVIIASVASAILVGRGALYAMELWWRGNAPFLLFSSDIFMVSWQTVCFVVALAFFAGAITICLPLIQPLKKNALQNLLQV